MYVSNQSLADDSVRIVVMIDGARVADDRFTAADQHRWATYRLDLAPGRHVITMGSDTGTSRVETVEMAEHGARWATVSYWYQPPDPGRPGVDAVPRSFEFLVSDEELGLA
jgi:hypothetical protein